MKERIKKTITTRPLPDSGYISFGKDIIKHPWDEVLLTKDINSKVGNFHGTLSAKLYKHFPAKTVKISGLDKKWFNPSLKSLHRKVQREYYKHRQSSKWRKLRRKFKKAKRKSIKSFHSKFVTDL